MCKEIQYLESIFPEYFQESAQAEGDVQEHNFQFPVNPEMEVNNEDRNIVQNIPGHFNIDTGLWEYESLSKHMSRYSTSSSISIFAFDCKSLSLSCFVLWALPMLKEYSASSFLNLNNVY